jgi:hypothetical protein
MKSIITEFEKQVVSNREQLLFAFLDSKGDVKESYTYAELMCAPNVLQLIFKPIIIFNKAIEFY